jgi:hypothetical protein
VFFLLPEIAKRHRKAAWKSTKGNQMLIEPIERIRQYEHGQPIPCVQGELINIYDQKGGKYKSGPNAGNPYTRQNAILKDKAGDEIRLTLHDRDDIKNLINRTVSIESSNKKGMTGVYAEDNDYWHKQDSSKPIERELKITKSATIDIIDGSAPAEPASKAKPASKPAAKSNPDELADCKRHLMQTANLYALCLAATHKSIEPAYFQLHGEEMPEGHRQAAVSTMFIHMDRQGYVGKMPVKPLEV